VAVVSFRSLGLEHVGLVGGKCAHLGDLTQAGFPVPPGFAVLTEAFESVVATHVDQLLDGLDADDVVALERKAAEVRAAVETLDVPGHVADAIRDGYRLLEEEVAVERPAVAVRSSAVAEDAADASFAGMQSTFLFVRGPDETLAAVRRCWASYFNAEALAYRARQAGAAAGMSVAVQFMVDARVAGVLFTLNPVSGDRSSIAIDASYGLGVTVVGGEVTPDSYLFSKVTRQPIRVQLGAKEVECVPGPGGSGTVMRAVPDELRARPCLEQDELERLIELGRDVERHYGRPQDIEWAIDRGLGELFLLQARPETVWTPRRVAGEPGGPAARVAALYLDSSRLRL
jgi:pyruvate,water dikinase